MLEFQLCPVGDGNGSPSGDPMEESNIGPFLFISAYFDLISVSWTILMIQIFLDSLYPVIFFLNVFTLPFYQLLPT